MAIETTKRSRITHRDEVESHQLLTNSINLLADRIEKTETDFVGHLKKVEDRLDQIVDLTKTVALLQQQTGQQTDQITEVRTQLREYSAKFDTSISRIHTRLDEIKTQQIDKMDLLSREIDMKVKTVEVQSNNNEKELKQWLNRGVGAWVVSALLVGAVNTALWRWVDNIERERTVMSQSIESNRRDHISYDNRLQIIENLSKDNGESVKKLQQSQRELEDSIFRRDRK